MHATHQPEAPPARRLTTGLLWSVAALVTVVVGIITVAFRGSWGALRDAALAAHFDAAAADLYPFAVDGLIIVAVISLVVLRHNPGARRYCLGIIAAYTGASFLLNFLHGTGTFTPDPATGAVPVPPWPVVFVIAALLVGSIFLGSHLVVHVWRHVFPDPEPASVETPALRPVLQPETVATPVAPPPQTNYEAACTAYRHSLGDGETRLSQRKLMKQFKLSAREAGQVQRDVHQELGTDQPAEEPEPTPSGQPTAASAYLNDRASDEHHPTPTEPLTPSREPR